ncbi:MAG: hypothetical protein K6G27_11400 [Lachnospiraceae bacterium]|nr:hypothetical protein [Lachnospiraceae bacterium]
MQIYTVEDITEADYGCEETGRKEPTALLKLIEDAICIRCCGYSEWLTGLREEILKDTVNKIEKENNS